MRYVFSFVDLVQEDLSDFYESGEYRLIYSVVLCAEFAGKRRD